MNVTSGLALVTVPLDAENSPLLGEELNPALPGREYFSTGIGISAGGCTLHTDVARETTDDE